MGMEKNKEKIILDAALDLFTTRGFQATRMEDIAKKAGISKGLTYFYYKNKEDLFMAMTKKAFDQLKECFRDIYRSKSKSGLQMIQELIIQIHDFAKTNPVYYNSIINFFDLMKKFNNPERRASLNPLILESIQFQKLLEIHHEPFKIGIMMISQGIKDGSVRPELQPEITFYTVWSLIIGSEKINGLIEFEGKETKVNPENWEIGLLKLIQDMLKGSIQGTRPNMIQTSLF